MAITHTPASTIQGEGTTLTLSYECSGDNRILQVSVGFIDSDESVQSITYNGVPLVLQRSCLLSPKRHVENGAWVVDRLGTHSETWTLVAPPVGTFDVVVTLTASVKAMVSGVCWNGVDQTNPIYFTNDGVGDDVTEIPLTVDLRDGSAAIGIGIAYADTSSALLPGQEELWNVAYGSNEFRTQGIVLIPNFSVVGVVTNVLPIPAPWSVNLLCLLAA